MVQMIIWSTKAIETFEQNIQYLKSVWTEKEVDKFTSETKRKLILLTAQPYIGNITNRRLNIRKTLIGKRILLIYRYTPGNGEIELLLFFNTWQDRKKIP
jgi:plasmid stabilization system protein ParE